MPGHLEKRSKDSWTIVIEFGRDPNTGKRKRIKRAYRGTKKDAEKELTRLLRELDTGTYVEPSHMTVTEYLEKWLQDYGKTNLAPSTFNSYSMIINKHLTPEIGFIPLSKLHPMHLQSYYSKALQEGRADGKGGLSNRTVLYHHRVIREALQHAVRWQLLARNVADAVEPPKIRRQENKVLDAEGVNKLLGAAAEHQEFELILTALYTGMRVGELLALRWQDIDFESKTARIQQNLIQLPGKKFIFAEPKTKKGRRQIALPQIVIDALKKYKKKQAEIRLQKGENYEDSDLVFASLNGLPLERSGVSHRFKSLVDSIGFKGLRFHDLRHTHATLLLTQGVHPKVVQERLGHENISITLDTYSHVLPGLQEEAISRLEQTLNNVKPNK